VLLTRRFIGDRRSRPFENRPGRPEMPSADMKANRPLSPHLFIYRWPVTMVVSILHRITGSALYVGMALLAWWLIAAATSERAFAIANGFLGSWLGRLILFGYSWALLHHMLGGLRHLVWDFGVGLERPARNVLAWGNVIGSAALTVLLWAVGLAVR
jgi:succinate dehydrogenase / fumarate reductase, cytochrome b subunit